MGKLFQNYILIVLASALYALAFNWCFVPNGIAFGGVTGIAQIINAVLPWVPVGTLVIVMNIPLFLLGWKLLGGHLLVSSLVAMAVSSVLIDAIAAVYTFLQGATTGGTDLIARLLKLKLAWLPVGKLLMGIDLTVIVAVGVAFRSLESTLYGLVALYISTLVMDGVLYGLDNAKVAYIISDKPEEIAGVIIRDLDRSVTYLSGEGGYSGASKRVILCAFKQREIVSIKETVRQIDPNAFMIVCAAHEVLGEGFRSYHQNEL